MKMFDANDTNLSIPFGTFGATPFELIDEDLDTHGIDYVYAHLLYVRLFGLVDWKRTARIGCHDFMLGFTGYLSDDAIVKILRVGSNNTARKAMKMLLDAGLVKRYQNIGDRCPHYRIMLFESAIAFLKDNPPKTVKVEYLADKDTFDKIKHTQKNNPKPKQSPSTNVDESDIDALTETCAYEIGEDAPDAHNQDLTKINTHIPTPPLDRGPLGDMEEEDRLDQSEDNPVHEIFDKAIEDHEKQEKASQRENHADLPFSEVLEVVNYWLGESNDFIPDAYRLDLAHQFHTKIHKHIMPAAARHVPDDRDRVRACIDVMRLWIDKVKSRKKPAKYPNFIDTGPGMTALTECMEQVLGGIATFAEMELDPVLVDLYKDKWGENWKEKREAEM